MKMLKIRPTSSDVLHTVFGGRADDDCMINSLPKPYKFTATPYETSDFDPAVREASELDTDFQSCMRVAKVIVVGDVAVGKTCLVKRFCHKTYDMEYKGTLGVDFEVRRFDILNAPFSLQLWDTAGQERFKSIASSYYRGAHAIVLTFDVSRMYSLQAIPQWLEETMQYNEGDPLLFMVGTKLDIPSPSKYSLIEKDAINMALALKAEYWAVSSKNGENVHDFFCRVAALTFTKAVLRELEVGPPRREIGDFASLSNQNKVVEKKRGCKSMCSR